MELTGEPYSVAKDAVSKLQCERVSFGDSPNDYWDSERPSLFVYDHNRFEDIRDAVMGSAGSPVGYAIRSYYGMELTQSVNGTLVEFVLWLKESLLKANTPSEEKTAIIRKQLEAANAMRVKSGLEPDAKPSVNPPRFWAVFEDVHQLNDAAEEIIETYQWIIKYAPSLGLTVIAMTTAEVDPRLLEGFHVIGANSDIPKSGIPTFRKYQPSHIEKIRKYVKPEKIAQFSDDGGFTFRSSQDEDRLLRIARKNEAEEIGEYTLAGK